jgi:hypothetical protein
MEAFKQYFVNNPWVGFAGVIIGLIGIVATIITFRRSRRIHLICFARTGTCLIDTATSSNSRLKIYYDDHPVRTFSITRVVMWNAGTESIRSNDLSKQQSFGLRSTSGKILDFTVVAKTGEANAIMIEKVAEDFLQISFDFLDPGDGFVVRISHDGVEPHGIRPIGKVIGVRQIRQRAALDPYNFLDALPPRTKSMRALPHSKWVILISVILAAIIAWFLLGLFDRFVPARHRFAAPWGPALVLLISLAPFVWFLYLLFRPVVPEALSKFFERDDV